MTVTLIALLAVSAPASIAFAATTSFTAQFTETTTILPAQACPPGVPAGSTCFVGVGLGSASPPGGKAVENFTGFETTAGTDANTVRITTDRGTLFLTTQGVVGNGGATETGHWTAQGGTGIFTGATGGGDVSTVATGARANGRVISSTTNYTGTLNLP